MDRDVRLVGRDREQAAIERALSTMAGGRSITVLVSGEPGVGKSRLIDAACAMAEARGARVLRGYALESGGMPPYFPLARALGPPLRGDADLAGLLPVLAAAGIAPAGDWATPPKLSPDAERLRLFDAVAECCARLAARGPLVLALDDLQWAEPATWETVVYSARALADEPLLLLLAVREEALHDAAGPAARALTELNRQRSLLHLPLARLPGEDVRWLAARMLGGEVSLALAALLAHRSEGNPFFAEEILRDLTERRVLRQGEHGWEIDPERRVDQLVPPLTLQLAIRQRVDRLPPETGIALEGAAVLGRSFAPRTLAAVVGWDRDRLEQALTPARAAGLIVEADRGWSFTHDVVRETVYETATGERRRLHAAAASAIQAEAGAAPEIERLAALAYHWRLADDPAEGAAAALAAAAAASAMHAPAEALAYARTGRELRERLDTNAADLAATCMAHAEAALAAGEYREADEAFRAALRAAERVDSRLLEGRIWARLGVLHRRRETPNEAAGCFRRALALLDDGAGDDAEVVRALVQLGGLEGMTRAHYAEAEALGRRALEMASRMGDAALEASAALELANTLSRSTDPIAVRPLLARSLERALAADDPALAAEVCATLSNSHYWTGELRTARRYAERRLALAERAGDVFGLRHAHSWLALLAYARGEWGTARDLLRTAEPVLARLDSPEPVAFLRIVGGLVDYQTGDLERAYAQVAEALELFERVDPGTVVWYSGVLALLLAVMERTAEAATVAAGLEARLAAMPASALPARSARTVLAFAYAELGDAAHAAACERALRPYAGDFHWHPARRALADLAARRGDRVTALADLAAVEAQARREELRPDLALALLARAELLPAGDAARARDLAEARSLLAELGMARDLARADRAASATVPTAPAGLTAREVEVLRLVTQGKTNREIATALVLSERTVINHLSHIFAKTGVENRAGATAFALRHGVA